MIRRRDLEGPARGPIAEFGEGGNARSTPELEGESNDSHDAEGREGSSEGRRKGLEGAGIGPGPAQGGVGREA